MAGVITPSGHAGNPVFAGDGILVAVSGSISASHSSFSALSDARCHDGSGRVRISAPVRARSRIDALAGRIAPEPGEPQASANSAGAERKAGVTRPTRVR